MATSAFSASLRALPAFTPGPAMKPITPPSMVMPAMPTLPKIDDARAPNAVGRDWLNQRLANLPGKYNPMLTDVRTGAQHALAGLGGWTWQNDNPATPEREDLAVPTKDPNAALGARETSAVWDQRFAANARGLLDSSFANKAVGSALLKLNEEAKSVVNQYATGIKNVIAGQQAETTDIITDLTKLYGEDARWLADNPPPKPPDWMAPPGTVGDVWAGYHQPNADELAAMYPGMVFSYRTDPDGRIVATARPAPPPPPGAPVAPGQEQSVMEPMGQKVGGVPESQQQWSGKQRPTANDLRMFARVWGVLPRDIEVRAMGGGGWVARPSHLFKNKASK